jgi:hypothetical protein
MKPVQQVRAFSLPYKGGHSDNRYTASGIRSQGSNFTQQSKTIHSQHFDVGQNHMRMVNFYCLEAFKPIPRDHDLCTRVIQKGTYMPSYVVVILDNDNREIVEIGRH